MDAVPISVKWNKNPRAPSSLREGLLSGMTKEVVWILRAMRAFRVAVFPSHCQYFCTLKSGGKEKI